MDTATRNSSFPAPLLANHRDLHLAFDVGHSSIGWAVLQTLTGGEPKLLGCGAVIFPADDCLASQRRQFRRQRRHIRSTRMRIARMKSLLTHLGLLTSEELDRVVSSSPWFLAARVLRGGPHLTWPELWDVLRWYAHNRGYDGNKAWSRQEEDAAAEKDDTEKVERARGLLADFAKKHDRPGSMAEVWCDLVGIDPLGQTKSTHLPDPRKRPKAQNAAFPREQVEREVATILRAHFGRLPHADETLLAALMTDWRALPSPAIKLPGRYQGGLLFGQLVPRFENRIIARCPITYERIFQRLRTETGDEVRAKDEAEKLSKVPAASCPEFFRYRWAMQLANILTHTPAGPRRLTPAQRRALDETARARGAFTKGDFKKAVRALTGGAPDNLDQMLLHPDAERALVVDPVQRLLADKDVAPFIATLSEPLKKRLRGQLRRGRRISLAAIREWTVTVGEGGAFDASLDQHLDALNTRRSKKAAETTRDTLLATILQAHPPSGRAPHSREIMCEAIAFTFEAVDPEGYGRHPAEGTEGAPDNGPLFRGAAIRTAQLQRAIDEQTNNHLVRHRLRLLDRLHADLLKTYAGDDKTRVNRITIEVNRELRDLSGQTAQDIAKDEGSRLKNFKDVAAKVTELLGGQSTRNFASLVRKARIATDLGCRCPYTGRDYDLQSVISGTMALDHIIPYSLRPSNSLDSLVVTFPEINELKANRTGLEFIQWANLPANAALRDKYEIFTENQYRAFVEGLDTRGHDDDRRRKRNRKRLLLLRDYVEKEFTPGDLTQTSQLVRLGAQTLERSYRESEEPTAAVHDRWGENDQHSQSTATMPVITSLPGSVTGAVRKSWRLTGSLEAGNPNILDPITREVRTKTEIRDITHLHHALDACVLVFASHFLPGRARDGSAWQLLVKRRLSPEEQARARELFHGYLEFGPKGEPRLIDLPKTCKDQIHDALAQRRVVQHIPAEFAGLRAELNAWRVVSTAPDTEGRLLLRQRIRQPDGTRPRKERRERPDKLVGLRPGKLQKLRAALVIGDNYGLALDPAPEIIPFHKVWVRLRELRAKNGGRPVRVLRNGMLIEMPRGKFAGIWRIFSLKNNASGIALDIGRPDIVRLRNKTEGHKINVLLASLLRDGLVLLAPPLSGVDGSAKKNPSPAEAGEG